MALASNRIPGTRVDLKKFEAKDKRRFWIRRSRSFSTDEISPTTKATLLKQIEQPLPEAKSPDEMDDNDLEVPKMRAQGSKATG